MTSYRLGRVAQAATLALVLAAAGCGPSSEAELLAQAKQSLAKQDRAAALVQLKNALQRNPDSGEARFLLGKALLQNGEGAAALIELDRAQNLKFDDDQLLPWLAQAMLANGQAKKLTDLYGGVTLSTPKATAELKAAIATGYVLQGQMGKCEEALVAALKADPRNVPARLQMARLVAGKNTDDALVQVDALIRDEPKVHEAQLLKAELLWIGKRDIDGAKNAFKQALAIEPRYQDAHSGLATMLFLQRDLAGFKASVAEMKKALPDRPQTQFYEAQQAIVDGDFRTARTLIEPLLKTSPRNVRVLQLAATLELVNGSPLIAESYLKRVLEAGPKLVAPRRLLAQTHMRSGDPDKALMVLRPLVEGDSVSSEDLALVAEAHLHAGDPGRAEEFFRRAAKLNPDSVNVRTALALTQIARGNAEAGFADLESAAAADKSSAYADMALISARLRRGEVDSALKAVDRLQAKQPDSALAPHLRGKLLAQRGDNAGARQGYEQALARDRNYYPAVTSLAGLDVAEGKLDAARQRFQDILTREPKNQRAMVALAQMMSLTRAKPAEVAEMLDKAVRTDPGDAKTRVAQIDFLLANNDLKAANSAAESGIAALPNDVAMLDAVGRVQMASGNMQQAIAAFGKAAAAQPGSARAQIRLGEGYMAARDPDNATRAYKRALELSPGSIPAQRGLVTVALSRKRYGDALAIARQLQKDYPTESVGWQLQSDTLAVQRDWPAAIAAMKESYKRAPSAEAALRMLALMASGDRLAEADAFVDAWRKDKPDDVRPVFAVAASHMARRDYPRAESRFREVVAKRPEDAVSINNIAWLMVQQKKTGAVAMAEQALKLAPEEPRVMDTLALALAAEGQLDKAVEWQRKATAKAPDEAIYRLGLARLLVQQGDKAKAREELDRLSKLGSGFSGQDEVAELLKRL